MAEGKQQIVGFGSGPHLTAAFLCERVLVEQDGVKSAVRIIDRLTHVVRGPNPPEQMEPFNYEFTLFISLKSGHARGTYPLRIVLVTPPAVETVPPFEQPVFFDGPEDRGADVIAQLKIKLNWEGLYWFQIFFGGKPLTQIPFRVIYMPQAMQIGGSGGSPPQIPGPPPSA
jgi:hypothetical protein